jgi:hypothetical protein
MKAHIQTVGKKVVLTVFYNPATCDWDEAITTGLAAYGLRQGHVTVIAEPLPENARSQGGLFE